MSATLQRQQAVAIAPGSSCLVTGSSCCHIRSPVRGCRPHDLHPLMDHARSASTSPSNGDLRATKLWSSRRPTSRTCWSPSARWWARSQRRSSTGSSPPS